MIQTWERTRWVSWTNAKIIRPYWEGLKIVGYIIDTGRGQEIARPVAHVKGI